MIEIYLTEEQVKILKLLQETVAEHYEVGEEGALLAQVFPLQAVAEVHFIDNNTCKELKKVLRNNGYIRKIL